MVSHPALGLAINAKLTSSPDPGVFQVPVLGQSLKGAQWGRFLLWNRALCVLKIGTARLSLWYQSE